MAEFRRELSVRNETSNLSRVRQFVGEFLDALSVSPEARYQLILAVDEAVSNIMEHAYLPGQPGPIHLAMGIDGDRLIFRFADRGQAFEPTAVHDPNLAEHFKAGRRKGLGIYLMRRIMDEVNYNFGTFNELTLIKRLDTLGRARGMKEDNLHARF